MTDIYFCPHRSSSSQTKFYIITFFQLLHVFLCSETSSKKVLGQWDTFICFDMQEQVIGSSVLDLQDKQWHIGVSDTDFRRTLDQGLKLWQYAWCHECAWPGYGMWQRQVGHKAERKYQTWFHFTRLKESTVLSKFWKELKRICWTIHRFLIQSISAASDCCAQPLYFCVLLFTWIKYLPGECLSTQSMLFFNHKIIPWGLVCGAENEHEEF